MLLTDDRLRFVSLDVSTKPPGEVTCSLAGDVPQKILYWAVHAV